MALKSVTLKLYIYSGTQGSYTASDLKYTISKDRISTKSSITIEIANLVRDYIDTTFNDDYVSSTKWVTVSQTLYDSDTGLEYDQNRSPVITNYLALDGYGYFEDSINPQLSTNALYTSNNMYLPEGVAGKFPIFAEGVGKVIIDSTTTQVTDSGNSNQKIQYLTIPANSSTIQVYDTDDSTLLKTITVNNVCEPKYTPYKITFINKLGALQDLYFFKKATETFNVTDEKYRRNNINTTSLSYNTYSGQQQRQNVNGTTSLSLNTGYVKEDFNSAIEELFLSENAWIRFENKTLPIIAKSKSFTHKTVLNDKLINHTVNFDFAFNKINNVR
tara:strand:- start:825 stop:1817 length:993 start_codon:yes stop_codon:yes gene_type:complete